MYSCPTEVSFSRVHCRHSLCLRFMFSLAVTLFVIDVAGTHGQEVSHSTTEPNKVRSSAYLLAPGDSIEIKFDYNRELDETIIIRPDGAISLALVGEMPAVNLSAEELAREISFRYAKVLVHPQAVVLVREFADQKIYVGGEVNGPGVFTLRGSLTAVQAIVQAGGAKSSARLAQVLLIRNCGNNAASIEKINLGHILKGQVPDVPLQAYDVLYVPRTIIAKAGLFVQQYLNDIVPKAIFFPYNLNNAYTVRP
jgi:protein involved in polysaccharide export with SLBB domain